jgi:hypothetical protein
MLKSTSAGVEFSQPRSGHSTAHHPLVAAQVATDDFKQTNLDASASFPLSAFALCALANSKPAEARPASVGGSRE